MAQTVTLQLPDEMLQRCKRGAMAARKLLEEFLVDRLMEATPILFEQNAPLLHASCENETLTNVEFETSFGPARVVASSRDIDPDLWTRAFAGHCLLTKQSQGTITAQERNTLQALGDEARLLTLKKAHASLVLRWRGHRIPTPAALQKPA